MNRLATLGSTLGFGLSLGAAGCAPRDVSTAELAPQSLVQLDVTYGRNVDAADVQLDAEAHFVRYRSVSTADGASPSVAALLGITSNDELAVGTCRNVDASEAGAASLEVALLDAGPLTLRNDGVVETVLEPHHYPEIVPYVTGVVYGQSGTPANAPSAKAHVEIEAEGGEDVGPFVASATLAHGFPGLSLSGAGRALTLSWNADGADVVIELRWSGAQSGAMRCRAADTGSVALASLVPSTTLDAALASGATVSVARTSRATLDAPGAGPGRLFVTMRDTAIVPVR